MTLEGYESAYQRVRSYAGQRGELALEKWAQFDELVRWYIAISRLIASTPDGSQISLGTVAQWTRDVWPKAVSEEGVVFGDYKPLFSAFHTLWTFATKTEGYVKRDWENVGLAYASYEWVYLAGKQ